MMRPTALPAYLAAGLCLAAVPVLAAPGRVSVPERFDGTWSVEIVTEAGTCDRAYRYPVRIENGQARFIGTAFDDSSLSSTEFELLRFLMRNPRRALSRAEILDRVWNYDFAGRTSIVDLYISYLRKKIDSDREPMIHTVRGVGYMLRPPE